MKSHARYTNPPVIEVVSGFVLQPVQGLTLPHFGLFWHRIRDEYPEAKHAAPLGLDESLVLDPDVGLLPPPRIWLIGKAQDQLIQLQRDRFYFNWREGPHKSQYVSYAEIFKRFQAAWELYAGFLADVALAPPIIRECELTYINHVPVSAGWTSMDDAGRVFVPLACPRGSTGFLPIPRSIAWTATFELPDAKGRLAAKIHPAFRGEQRESILVLELSAKGLGAGTNDDAIEGWFETAHEWIVKGFEDLTSPDIQRRIWGKQ